MNTSKRQLRFALLSASALLLMAGPASAQRGGSVEALLQEAQEHANTFRASEAEATFRQVYVAHSQLGFTEVSRSNRDVALRELHSAEVLWGSEAPDWRLAQLALAYAQLGRVEDVNRIYERLQGMSTVTHASWAMADIARGSYGDALDHLEAAVSRSGAAADSPVLGELRANVYNDPALEGPSFKTLLDSVVAGD